MKANGLYFKLLPIFTLILAIYWGFDLMENLKINNMGRFKMDLLFLVIFGGVFLVSSIMALKNK